jgi:hypothetical protein
MNHRLLAAAAAALLLAAPLAPGLVADAAHAEAQLTAEPVEGTTWALQPSALDGPDGRVSLRHTVVGGESIDDLIALTNYSATPQRFALYASDGTITADGSFDLVPPDQAPEDGGTWIGLDAVQGAAPREGGGMIVEVPAGTALVVPVRISVPANATPGDHPAGIVAELVREGSGVQLSTRVGVRVHLRVTGDLVGELAPEKVDASYTPSWNPFAPGTVTVRYTLANAGNVRLGSQTTVSAAGAFGVGGGSASSEQREILPGDVIEASVELPVWPLFFSWGEVEAEPGVVGEDEGEVDLTPASATFTLWTVPWSQLLLIAAAVGAFLLLRWLRIRSQQRTQARIDAAVAAATAGTVPALAGVTTPAAIEAAPSRSEDDPAPS